MLFTELKTLVGQYATDTQVREFGPLTRKDTWQAAYDRYVSPALQVEAAAIDAELQELGSIPEATQDDVDRILAAIDAELAADPTDLAEGDLDMGGYDDTRIEELPTATPATPTEVHPWYVVLMAIVICLYGRDWQSARTLLVELVSPYRWVLYLPQVAFEAAMRPVDQLIWLYV